MLRIACGSLRTRGTGAGVEQTGAGQIRDDQFTTAYAHHAKGQSAELSIRCLQKERPFLKTELGITDAQEDVWDDYADAARNSARSMQQMRDTMMSGDWPTWFPERMERREQMMSARIETMSTLRKAAVPLYQALNDQQKLVADNMMGMGMM